MKVRMHAALAAVWLATSAVACAPQAKPADASRSVAVADALPSWRESVARQQITEFVAAVTDASGADYVEPAERIAVFDNDGTLWAEKPLYFQLLFALDRVRALAPEHPEWESTEPFASVLRGDLHSALAGGEKALLQLVMATHAGMTVDEFDSTARDWLATAKHPESGLPYDGMVYQPMLELLAYLRANDFKTFIVSGGGVDMIRTFSERVYGIPPEQVVGSTLELEFGMADDRPYLLRKPEIDFIDDKAGKPVAIQRHIGRRPIAAFGNSDGDLQMLQWTTAGDGRRLGVLIRHTDSEREWAYDRDSSVGRLDKALDLAPQNRWTVVDMKADWSTMFPPTR